MAFIGVQMQAVVVATPAGADLLGFFEDEEGDSGSLEAGAHGQTSRAGADDDGLCLLG